MRRSRLISCVFAFVTLLAFSNSFAAETGCKEFVGWLIYPNHDSSASLTEQHCGDKKYWQLVTREGKVLTQIPVPLLTKGYEFNYGDCNLDSKLRHDIIAMVHHKNDVEWSTKISKAWLADLTLKTIVPISTEGLSCRNEGYGL